MDYGFLLEDRIAKIKSIDEQYNLCENGYISFSGGKDSTILHHLIDMALPNNQIPRVFINTGIEYKAICDFVKELSQTDKRFVIIQPTKNIRAVLEEFGYPFKSKEHSCKLSLFQKNSKSKSVEKYINGTNGFACPKSLKYQFTPAFTLKVSDQCCYKLKKEPVHKWESENHKKVAILGVRTSEGGQRSNHTNCVVLDSNGGLTKFKPLNPMEEDWEDWFIKEHKIELCILYNEPYNFKRTGCKGCPFSIDIEKQLEVMSLYLPNEKKQCELVWSKVYAEYRKLGYRLKKQTNTLF